MGAGEAEGVSSEGHLAGNAWLSLPFNPYAAGGYFGQHKIMQKPEK